MGLQDESLVTNLRPFLRQGGVTDEDLVKHLNDLATVQAERQAKSFSATVRPRPVAANAVCIDSDSVTPLRKIQLKYRENETDTKTLSAEVRELKSELAELKRTFVGDRVQQAPRFQQHRGQGRGQIYGQRYNRRQIGCRQCQSKGKGNTCQRCFKCGDIYHFNA